MEEEKCLICNKAIPEGRQVCPSCEVKNANQKGIDIEKAIEIKHEYNKGRPYKHGGKKC